MEWRGVVGYRKLYEVSDCGMVRNAKNGELLSGCITPDGYRVFGLTKNGVMRNWRAHVLVLRAFKRLAVGKEQGCHNDGDKLNNHVSNLRWGTPRSNAKDRMKHGTQLLGEKVSTAKLTGEMVKEARLKYPKVSVAELARLNGVSHSAMFNAVFKKTWKHIG